MTDRTIIVDVGDWDRREVYRGTNVFLAGLAAAHAERDKRRGAMPEGVGYCDPDRCDYADDFSSDGLAEDVHDFLGGCCEIGCAFKSRRRRRAA